MGCSEACPVLHAVKVSVSFFFNLLVMLRWLTISYRDTQKLNVISQLQAQDFITVRLPGDYRNLCKC